jgi:hypothetical protein
MIGYPAYHGLPKYEATRFLLEDQEDFSVQKHQEYDVSHPLLTPVLQIS